MADLPTGAVTFAIDRIGDTTAGAVTIYRISGGTPHVIGVITPARDLLG